MTGNRSLAHGVLWGQASPQQQSANSSPWCDKQRLHLSLSYTEIRKPGDRIPTVVLTVNKGSLSEGVTKGTTWLCMDKYNQHSLLEMPEMF